MQAELLQMLQSAKSNWRRPKLGDRAIHPQRQVFQVRKMLGVNLQNTGLQSGSLCLNFQCHVVICIVMYKTARCAEATLCT